MTQNLYSNPCFDRAVSLRKSSLPGSGEDVLLLSSAEKFYCSYKKGAYEPVYFPIRDFAGQLSGMVFLGRQEGRNIWTLSLDAGQVGDFTKLPPHGRFLGVREMAGLLPEQAALLAYALGITKWNTGSAFCGRCGAVTEPREGGHSRHCKNEACAAVSYPQIAPAVIVLIEYHPAGAPPQCLLNIRHTPEGIQCSPFAGFVEIGERLEDAVMREMMEEVQVEVTDIRYANSQPWSFSSALMIGFHARAKRPDFRVDAVEVREAAWFTAAQLNALVSETRLSLSRPDSIARNLIENWMRSHL